MEYELGAMYEARTRRIIMKRVLRLVCGLVVALTLFTVLAKTVLDVLDLPVMVVSPVTGKCLRVETLPDQPPMTCDELKATGKYHTRTGLPQ